MARKQTRGSISLSAATHEAIVAAAQREGVAASELVTRMVRTACPDLPKQLHQSRAEDRSASAAMTRGVPRERRTVPRAELDSRAAEHKIARNGIPPGTFCANCIDRKATHYGRIDRTDDRYAVCDACELPENEERTGWHRQRGTAG